jgi:hypothetical protein
MHVLLAAAATAAAGERWTTVNDPRGFTVQHPNGWAVRAGDDGEVAVVAPQAAGRVSVQPLFMADRPGALEIVARLPKLLAARYPNADVVATRRHRRKPDEVFAVVAFRRAGTPHRAKLLCSVHGPSGMLYAIEAPAKRFNAQAPTLVRVLKSFAYRPPDAQHRRTARGPAVTFQRWTDPRQDAFSLELPKGWKAEGGMIHRNAVDPRSVIRCSSPDGAVFLYGGDAQVPSFTLPTQMLMQTGFREGAMYSPGYGVKMMVMRHLPGAVFAEWYVRQNLPDEYDGLKITKQQQRPETVKALNAIYKQYNLMGMNTSLHAGEVSFTCRKGDKEIRGYCFATTQLTSGMAGGGGVWQFTALYGYLAEAGREKYAQVILGHAVKSFRLNPDWVRKQQNLTGKVSDIVTKTGAEIAKIIDDTYENRQRAQDDIARKWSNTTLGLTDVRDPETGETWKVTAGRNYYWRRDYANEVEGTDVWERPDTDFTPLEEW